MTPPLREPTPPKKPKNHQKAPSPPLPGQRAEIEKATVEIQRSLGGEVKADGHIGPVTINAMEQREKDLRAEIITMQQEAEDLNATIGFFSEKPLPEAEPSL